VLRSGLTELEEGGNEMIESEITLDSNPLVLPALGMRRRANGG
jgi:hypothetical protein